MWEVVLILVVALIVLGPRQLTEVAKVAGRMYRELQKMAFDVRNTIDLDSIDTSPRPSPPRYEPLLPKTETKEPELPTSEASPKDMPSAGQRTGPDFYAELLEKSREEDEAEKTSEKAESEKVKLLPPEPEKPSSERVKP